jgi:hypothetical protein
MGGNNRKMKNFKVSWLYRRIGGVLVRTWCTSDPSDNLKAKCLICPVTPQMPFGRKFSITEGFSALEKHSRARMHRNSDSRGEGSDILPRRQVEIEAAFKTQQELSVQVTNENHQLLKSQILFTNMVHTHGLPSCVFTCFANLAPKLFSDSNIAKRWGSEKEGMRKTKGDYFQIKEDLSEKLRTNFFSLNID